MPFFEILHVNALIFFTLLMILHYSLTIFNINANALSLIFFINANTLVRFNREFKKQKEVEGKYTSSSALN